MKNKSDMTNESIKLIEMAEHDSISVCLYIENKELFQLGERINTQYEEAYMNGYNWDAILSCYVASVDAELEQEIGTDPEAGMFVAYMSHSRENLEKMKRYESVIRNLLDDEPLLMKFISENYDEIEWD